MSGCGAREDAAVATFTFTVPVAGEVGAAAADRAAVAAPAPEPGEPPRVLVVDDDPRALRPLPLGLLGQPPQGRHQLPL